MKRKWLFILMLVSQVALSQPPGDLIGFQKISATVGNFTALSGNIEDIGRAMAVLKDKDGDGINEIAVNAYDATKSEGCLFILFMKPDFTVKSSIKIGSNENGFNGTFGNLSNFACSISSAGDLDKDGIEDLIVGNSYASPNATGCIYVLFLNANGTVKSHKALSVSGLLKDDNFGASVTNIGDVDKDGVQDFAVGAVGDDAGLVSKNFGAVYILFIQSTGDMKSYQKIGQGVGGLGGELHLDDRFGRSLTALGDFDKDGVPDVVAGNPDSITIGVVRILLLNSNGTVKSKMKIGENTGGYNEPLEKYSSFGGALASIGDIDGDSVIDLAVGCSGDSVGGFRRGSIRILGLTASGAVKFIKRINHGLGGEIPYDDDNFGVSICKAGDINKDKKLDIIVGARGRDDGGLNKGAFYQIFLDGIIQSNVGIKEHAATTISVYPNPSSTQAWLQLSESTTYPVTVQVINQLGQQVLVQQLNKASEPLRIQHLPAGMYLLQVQQGEQNYFGKLLKTGE